MPEERLTITSSTRLHPDEVARHTFGTARRGFDPAEVRAFLDDVARDMAAMEEREQELRRAVAAAENRAAHPVLDDATLTAALGQETARVLQTAHDAAGELTARAEGDAARRLAQAREEAEQMQHRAEQGSAERIAQAEAAAAEVRRRAQEEAAARLDGAKLEADTLVNQARAECRSMVQEAQELRGRVLADLTRRRRVLHSQIEQLRAGRERLAETIGDVRVAVDQITEELFRAEDEARLAAEVAGRQAAQEELTDVATATADVADAAEQRPSIDDLFARLRAEAGTLAAGIEAGVEEAPAARPTAERPRPARGPSVDAVRGAEPSAADATPEPVPGAGAEEAGHGPGPGSPTGPVATASTGGEDAAGEEVAAEAEPADEVSRDPELVRRDETLGPVVASLARRLKRALQDDQNDILDRLRAKGGWGPNVLLSEDEHAQRYVRASLDPLLEAARAGALFGGGKADDAPRVEDVAAALALDIVAPLRRRLDGEGRTVEVGDEGALVEMVGAAFREWKGARVERLAGDQAVFAFARAALAVAPTDGALRWVVDDDGAQCPDCDDNALAGAVPAGDEFPTGHRHPPAHAGCRCLLTPASA